MHLTKSLLKRLFFLTKTLSPHASERVIIACFPKSASTFLRNVMAEITGYATEEICVGVRNEEQDIYLPTLIDKAFTGISSRMHMRAKDENVRLMRMCGLKPVVLVRNIFDITASLVDHCSHTPIFGIQYMGDYYNSQLKERQADMIIDICLPWYFTFFSSWVQVQQSGALDTYWLSYEEMMADKTAAASGVCAFYGIKAGDEAIQAAVAAVGGDRVRSGINVGITGRGKTLLSEEQRRRILKMASYYPNIDFSRIGLDPVEVREAN
ncbi:sulfotransferase domain-containing protein [Desulfovibrio aminophilus]|uniref:sulfotransferase domain-containing protein n=1 Tax=Desulfovibrio aminophilus TaxID=81425 RepID=UPI00042A2B95|nr:sulfotransferase domain-containing protein [Desulfovibrio aminophilus]